MCRKTGSFYQSAIFGFISGLNTIYPIRRTHAAVEDILKDPKLESHPRTFVVNWLAQCSDLLPPHRCTCGHRLWISRSFCATNFRPGFGEGCSPFASHPSVYLDRSAPWERTFTGVVCLVDGIAGARPGFYSPHHLFLDRPG